MTVYRRLQRLAACVLGALLFSAGCVSSPSSPTNSAAFSEVDLLIGTGATAVSGNTLTVSYTGWLYDASQPEDKGAVFDTSGATPFSFQLGSSQVIAGWDQGLVGMRVGGVRRLVIPPSLAYGAVRHGTIPPQATLVFEIQLASVSAS